MELFPQEHFQKLPSPRTLNTHFRFSQLAENVSKTNSKIIFLSRNPKDVAVSFYHHIINIPQLYHYDGTWDDFLELFIDGKGQWAFHIHVWPVVLL